MADKAARRKRFEDVFPIIAEELTAYVRGEGMPKDAVEWYERVSRPDTFPSVRVSDRHLLPVACRPELMYRTSTQTRPAAS